MSLTIANAPVIGSIIRFLYRILGNMLQEQPRQERTMDAQRPPPPEQAHEQEPAPGLQEEDLPPARQPIMWSTPSVPSPAPEPEPTAAVPPPEPAVIPEPVEPPAPKPQLEPPISTSKPAEPEAPPDEELIGVPKVKTPDYSDKCKTILAGSKMLDLVMIVDNSSNVVTKAAKRTPQSTVRKISPSELVKTVLRAHIAKGAFDVNAAQTGRASSIRVQYNAMDVILYPLENNLTLMMIGLIEPAALDEVYDLIAREFPSKQKMAMIVDDEEDIRKSIEQVLVKRGFKVETADSGWHALDAIKSAKEKGLEYGIAILDIRMPGMDGFELFKRISQVSPNTKMLFITAFEYSQEDVARMVSVRNVKLLRKPFKRADLLQFITEETTPKDLQA